MQVTSMLSAGYLQPSNSLQPVTAVQRSQAVNQVTKNSRFPAVMAKSPSAASQDSELVQQEKEVLSQERDLKAKLGTAAEVHTVYHYAMGPDGRSYITGATVTMRGEQEDLDRVSSGGAGDVQKQTSPEAEAEESKSAQAGENEENEKSGENGELSEEEQAQVRKLKQAEQEVIAHEMAHMAAAGGLGGGVSYTYTQGPDGQSYITGGEVPIQLKQGSSPEETLRNMQQVQRAASAPAEPSGQDRQVAAEAAAMAAQARSEIMAESAASDDSEDGGKDKEDDDKTVVAKGTPVLGEGQSRLQRLGDPARDGVSSLMASVRESELQHRLAA